MREMRKAMVHKSGDMMFWPIAARPPDQLALELGESKPYPSLQELHRRDPRRSEACSGRADPNPALPHLRGRH